MSSLTDSMTRSSLSALLTFPDTQQYWCARAPWICRWKSKLEVQSRREPSDGIRVDPSWGEFRSRYGLRRETLGCQRIGALRELPPEDRVLMTLDSDFANVQACSPKSHPGIVVLRPESQDKPALVGLLKRLVSVLLQLSPKHQLWIVEPDRIRYREE